MRTVATRSFLNEAMAEMFHYKTLAGLMLAELSAGGVVLMVTRSDNHGESSQPAISRPTGPQSSVRDGDAPSGQRWTPRDELNLRALREGVGAVRGEFHAHVKQGIAALEPARKKRYVPGPIFRQPLKLEALRISWWTDTWARAEARAIYRGGPVPQEFEQAVWAPLLEAAVIAHSAHADLLKDLKESREERIHLVNPDTGEKQVDAKELERYEAHLDHTRREHTAVFEDLFLTLAELAKIADRPDLVKQVFEAYDGKLPKQNAAYVRIGEFESAENFVKYDHEVFEKKYGHHVPPPPDPPVPGSKFPVTEEEQKAIRALFDALGQAVIAQDEEALLSLHVGNRDRLRRFLKEDLSEIKTLSYDMSKARFQFSRDEEDGPVTVHLTDLFLDRLISGKREKGTGSSLKTVIFVHGTPKIRIFQE